MGLVELPEYPLPTLTPTPDTQPRPRPKTSAMPIPMLKALNRAPGDRRSMGVGVQSPKVVPEPPPSSMVRKSWHAGKRQRCFRLQEEETAHEIGVLCSGFFFSTVSTCYNVLLFILQIYKFFLDYMISYMYLIHS